VLFDNPSEEVQLATQFRGLAARLKSKFKRAVVHAVKEWQLEAYGPLVLRRLATLAAYVKASAIVGYLRGHIFDQLSRLPVSEFRDNAELLIAIVVGFAPDPDVAELLRQLYDTLTFMPDFAAQLYLGLCSCDPRRYPEYTHQFLCYLSTFPQIYRMDIVFSEFVRIVTLRRIADGFNSLESQDQYRLLKYLCDEEWSPAHLVVDVHLGICLASNPRFDALA
jgi:hypothetical protein